MFKRRRSKFLRFYGKWIVQAIVAGAYSVLIVKRFLLLMFAEKYKNLFYNDKIPYQNQLDKISALGYENKRKSSNDFFTMNARRVMNSKPEVTEFKPLGRLSINRYSEGTYKQHQVPTNMTVPFKRRQAPEYPQYGDNNNGRDNVYARTNKVEPRESFIPTKYEDQVVTSKEVEQKTSRKIMDALSWEDDFPNLPKKPSFERIPQEIRDPLHQLESNEESSIFSNKSHPISNNRISYNFITGEDFDKKEPRKHIYLNQSDGVIDMFNSFKTRGKNKDMGAKNTIENFNRKLADARKGLLSNMETGKMLQKIAQEVFPENRYEKFMRNNLNNQPRVDSFKEAINRRIQNKLRIEKKRVKLRNILQRERRR